MNWDWTTIVVAVITALGAFLGTFLSNRALAPIGKRCVAQVRGLEGANAYQLPPDSSTILIDSEQPLIWFISTDANGNKSMVQPYKIERYEVPKPITLEDLMAEMRKMNERLIRVEGGGGNEPAGGTAE